MPLPSWTPCRKRAIRKEYLKRAHNNGNPVLFSISKDGYKEGILKKESKLMETLFYFQYQKRTAYCKNPLSNPLR
jgi:hypothetical protein